jgi:hypothetical protein
MPPEWSEAQPRKNVPAFRFAPPYRLRGRLVMALSQTVPNSSIWNDPRFRGEGCWDHTADAVDRSSRSEAMYWAGRSRRCFCADRVDSQLR